VLRQAVLSTLLEAVSRLAQLCHVIMWLLCSVLVFCPRQPVGNPYFCVQAKEEEKKALKAGRSPTQHTSLVYDPDILQRVLAHRYIAPCVFAASCLTHKSAMHRGLVLCQKKAVVDGLVVIRVVHVCESTDCTLCRADRNASKFLKKELRLPKKLSTGTNLSSSAFSSGGLKAKSGGFGRFKRKG
jgi:hypothetical protein